MRSKGALMLLYAPSFLLINALVGCMISLRKSRLREASAMRARLAAIISGLLVPVAVQADIAGLWRCVESGIPYSLMLEGPDSKFVGTATFGDHRQTITSGKSDGQSVEFVRDLAVQNIRHTGVFTQSQMVGYAVNRSNSATARFECIRLGG